MALDPSIPLQPLRNLQDLADRQERREKFEFAKQEAGLDRTRQTRIDKEAKRLRDLKITEAELGISDARLKRRVVNAAVMGRILSPMIERAQATGDTTELLQTLTTFESDLQGLGQQGIEVDSDETSGAKALVEAGSLDELQATIDQNEAIALAFDFIDDEGENKTSDIRNFEFFQNLNKDKQKTFMNVKRAQRALDFGGSFGFVNSVTGKIEDVIQKSLRPGEEPDVRGAQAGAAETAKLEAQLELAPQVREAITIAQEVGKTKGEALSKLNSMVAKFPRLVEVTKKLGELSKTATFTEAGKAANALRRQLGLPVGEGAVDRAELEAIVDNEVLPLLRDTFGNQFTEREGESLKGTLMNPDLSPPEKEAVLRAFIAGKVGQTESLKRETGQTEDFTGFEVIE